MIEQEIVQQIEAALIRIELLMAVLYSVIERNGAQAEGYYHLRQLNELIQTQRSASTYEELLQFLTNYAATVATKIELFDKEA